MGSPFSVPVRMASDGVPQGLLTVVHLPFFNPGMSYSPEPPIMPRYVVMREAFGLCSVRGFNVMQVLQLRNGVCGGDNCGLPW